MKTLLWIIIITALIFGGYHLYKKYADKPAEQTEETVAAPAPAPAPEQTPTPNPAQSAAQAPAPAPAPAPGNTTPNSGKGIKNWKPVKKVIDLSNQHNQDLEKNM